MTRSAAVCVVVGLAAASCRTTAPPPAPPLVAAVITPAKSSPRFVTDADELCAMLFEAPLRTLNRSCGAQDKKTDAYMELAEVATKRTADCKKALATGTNGDANASGGTSPGPSELRFRVELNKAQACATEIESVSWRVSLRDANIARFSACRELFHGTQQQGQACRLSVECSAGLVCDGRTEEAEGKCQRRVAKLCDEPVTWLFGEGEAQCSANAFCDGAHLVQQDDFAGLAPDGKVVRAYALRDQAEFGMIGLLNSGGTSPIRSSSPEGSDKPLGAGGLGLSGIGEGGGGTGEGIGLGSIGTIGQPQAGLGKRPPRVRVGGTQVKGRLPPEVIQRIVRSNFGRFRLCYQAGLEKDPKLQGKVTVRFTITKAGTVSKVSSQSDIPNVAVTKCVEAAFRTLTFPQPEGIVTVSYPIIFSPGDADPENEPSATPDESDTENRLTCAPRLMAGEACEHESQCRDGFCQNGTCASGLSKEDGSCDWDGECEPAYFCGPPEAEGDDRTSVCKPLLTVGQTCTSTSECEGACIEDQCVAFCNAGG